jgi:hypothetical protein
MKDHVNKKATPQPQAQPVERAKPTILQRIVMAWLDKSACMNLVYSDKKYKELQLQFMLDLESKMGNQFPQEIMDCLNENKDVAILLRSTNNVRKDTGK